MMDVAQIEHDMINGGWKKFISHYHQRSDSKFYVESFQTKITDDLGIRYFINCTKSDFSKSGIEFFKSNPQFTYTFDMQFTDAKKQSINIETVGWKFYPDKFDNYVSTMTDIYILAEDMWVSFGKHYYDKYEVFLG